MSKWCWNIRLFFNPFFNGFHSSTLLQVIGNKSANLVLFFSQIESEARISLTKLSRRVLDWTLGWFQCWNFLVEGTYFCHNVKLSRKWTHFEKTKQAWLEHYIHPWQNVKNWTLKLVMEWATNCFWVLGASWVELWYFDSYGHMGFFLTGN